MANAILAAAMLITASACSILPSDRAPSGEPPQPIAASASSSASSAIAIGVEVQAYPAGVIAGLHAEYPLNERDELTARLGWNETDRGDWGKHDDEHGGGPGGGLGWRRFLGPQFTGWLFGGRVDVWALRIDWSNSSPASMQGESDVLVVQPTLEAGYRWRLGDSRWRLDLTGSFGYEINVAVNGEDVGEGPIGLVGVTFTYGL